MPKFPNGNIPFSEKKKANKVIFFFFANKVLPKSYEKLSIFMVLK